MGKYTVKMNNENRKSLVETLIKIGLTSYNSTFIRSHLSINTIALFHNHKYEGELSNTYASVNLNAL